jgi:hypothetical protein
MSCRVARWFSFEPNIPIWLNFAVPCEGKMLVHLICIWNILLQFGNLVVSWYIFPPFGILYQEKSGNPDELAENAAEQKRRENGKKAGKMKNGLFVLRPELNLFSLNYFYFFKGNATFFDAASVFCQTADTLLRPRG